MRRLVKLLHTIGAIGLMGSMACLLVLIILMPTPRALVEYAVLRQAMGAIATWVFIPSLGLTLIAGLMAIALNPRFHNAGWAWVKLATGILIFEGGFVSVLGPLQQGAEQSGRAVDPAMLAAPMAGVRNTVCILLAVAMANVILGIWRPRLIRS